MHVANHHAGFRLLSQLPFGTLHFRDQSASVASESALMVERSIIIESLACRVIEMCVKFRLALRMQHLVWRIVWGLEDIAIISSCEPLVGHALMEIYSCLHCFPPKLEWCLRIQYH